MRVMVVMLCALMVGCSAGQNLMQNGQTAVTWPDAPIRFMRETPQPPPRECPISMLIEVRYLEVQEWPWYRADKWFADDKPSQFFKTCPDRHMDPKSDVKLVTWEPIGLAWSPSPFRTVGPAGIQAAGLVAAFGTLGALMPGTEVTQSVNGVVNGSPVKTSTLLINGPVPPGVAR